MNFNLELKDFLLEKPKESGEYLCYIYGEWAILHYSKVHDKFNCYDHFDEKYANKHEIKISHWAELPEV